MRYQHLDEAIDGRGEELRTKTVTIIGLGGIGSSLADLFVRSGVNLRLIEKGRVEEEDLDRLSVFTSDDISRFKATQAKKHLSKVNPDVTIKSFNEEITENTLFLLDSDLILDCSGYEELSQKICGYAFKQGIPCVLGLIRDTKCVVSSATDKKDAYEQLNGLKAEFTEGLLPSATHMTAGFMYTKGLKLLLGEKPKRGVVVYDVWKQQFEDKRGKKK